VWQPTGNLTTRARLARAHHDCQPDVTRCNEKSATPASTDADRFASCEVRLNLVSELCQIPTETPVKHRELRGHSDKHRCCGKWLWELRYCVSMCVSTRGRHLFPSVLLQPLGHLSVLVESTVYGPVAEPETSIMSEIVSRPPNVVRSLTGYLVPLGDRDSTQHNRPTPTLQYRTRRAPTARATVWSIADRSAPLVRARHQALDADLVRVMRWRARSVALSGVVFESSHQ
jgi:hypothetical protein